MYNNNHTLDVYKYVDCPCTTGANYEKFRQVTFWVGGVCVVTDEMYFEFFGQLELVFW